MKHKPGGQRGLVKLPVYVGAVLDRIVRADERYYDFAPFRGPKVCLSVNGRWRGKHEPDKDDRCIFCNKQV